MTTGSCAASRFTTAAALQSAVSTQYHVGLSGPLGAAGASVYYGYLLKPDTTEGGGFRQRSDTASKEALINYSSGNLIDRDLAFFPRVTDGDFSGGGYQEVWLQTNRYFDSDLDPRIPGYLQLRSSWTRVTTAVGGGSAKQVVTYGGDFWYTLSEANGNVYAAHAGTSGSPVAASIKGLDTDGTYLYAGTGTQLYRSTNGTAWTQVTTALNGTAVNWWVVDQGTNGYFAYYQVGTNALYKIDLTLAFTIAAAAQPQVPTGANPFKIIDLCEYQTAIAILTADVSGNGCDVWYHDGVNMTRIVRLEGYIGRGICNALGNLYVAAEATTNNTSPILAQISSGSFTVVARPGSPFPAAQQQTGQPRAASQYVYWPLFQPSIKGISGAPGVVLQYDTATGAVTHLPNFDATDYTGSTPAVLRQIAAYGDNVAVIFSNLGNTMQTAQFQTQAFGTFTYSPSGWLVSSHIDFATPGVVKRLRRIEVHHAPLNAGEQILIEAFVDQDPLSFTTSLTPSPATATATNSTVGSSLTAMTFGADTIGKTLYFALKLTAGTAQLTSPRVSYVSIEVGGTWSWELVLACTSKRQLLDGQNTETQPTGKDLAYLLLLAYEQGQNLTLYHRNGQSYTVAIETAELWNPSPLVASQPQEIRDEEYYVHTILRQVA